MFLFQLGHVGAVKVRVRPAPVAGRRPSGAAYPWRIRCVLCMCGWRRTPLRVHPRAPAFRDGVGRHRMAWDERDPTLYSFNYADERCAQQTATAKANRLPAVRGGCETSSQLLVMHGSVQLPVCSKEASAFPRRRAVWHRGWGGRRSHRTSRQSHNRGCLAQAPWVLGKGLKAQAPGALDDRSKRPSQFAARTAPLAPRAGPARSRLRLAAAYAFGPRPRAAGRAPRPCRSGTGWGCGRRRAARPAVRHARPPRTLSRRKRARCDTWLGRSRCRERDWIDRKPHRVLPTIAVQRGKRIQDPAI